MLVSLSKLVLLATALETTSAHYLVNRLINNGAVTNKWQHMLESGRVLEPVKGDAIKSTDFRCGANAWGKAGSVTPMKVTAGSRIGFMLGDSVPRISQYVILLLLPPHQASYIDEPYCQYFR